MNVPFHIPSIDESDKKAVESVLESRFLTQGREVLEFENKFAKISGFKHAAAVSSGTAALTLALQALGIGEGDEVILPSFTFVATANAVANNRAKPVFCEIKDDFTIDAEDMAGKINANTKAIIPVHYGARKCDMKNLLKIAEENNTAIVDDAAHAAGIDFSGKTSVPRLACFSFHATKTITSGEGGMILSNSQELINKAKALRNHGFVSNGGLREQRHLGGNMRMTDLQAAIGLSQLSRINSIIEGRIRIKETYDSILKEVKGILAPGAGYSSLYTIRVKKEHRNALRNFLLQNGIETKIYFSPVHLEPYYKGGHSLPKTELIGSEVISLPFYNSLTEPELSYICEQIKSFF